MSLSLGDRHSALVQALVQRVRALLTQVLVKDCNTGGLANGTSSAPSVLSLPLSLVL